VASSPPFHNGEAGVAYAAVALSATGGRAPYTWSVVSGALPNGLNLGGDGSIAGSPTAAGVFSFTVQVSDSGTGTATIPGTIQIAEQLTATLISPCAQYCRVELGCDSACGTFGTLAGGVGPYTYTVTQGPLPAGTSLNGLSLTGTFRGNSGWLQIGVQVSDSLGGSASVAPKFWMYDHISLSGGTCTGRVTCTVTLGYSGGLPGTSVSAAPTTWTPGSCGVTASAPCPAPSFTATYQPGSVVITLHYQPNYPATFGTLGVQLTDGDRCGASTYCETTASVNVVG
jgi:hypothetical protein